MCSYRRTTDKQLSVSLPTWNAAFSSCILLLSLLLLSSLLALLSRRILNMFLLAPATFSPSSSELQSDISLTQSPLTLSSKRCVKYSTFRTSSLWTRWNRQALLMEWTIISFEVFQWHIKILFLWFLEVLTRVLLIINNISTCMRASSTNSSHFYGSISNSGKEYYGYFSTNIFLITHFFQVIYKIMPHSRIMYNKQLQ